VAGRPAEIKALAGARAFPPLILVLFHFCEGHKYRGMDGPMCQTDWWHTYFVCSKWFDLPVARGYVWVEFFFALSGFILVHVYGSRARDFWTLKSGAYFTFLKARLARLYPVHFVTLLSMLLLMWTLNQLSYLGGYVSIFHQPWGPINTWPSFVANLFLVQAWNIYPVLTWNGAAWFVSVEFLLCLLFPVYLILSRGRWWMGAALVGFGVSWLLFLAVAGGHGLDVTFHDGIFRGMAGFAVGVGLSKLYREAKARGIDRLPEWAFHAAQAVAIAYLLWAAYQTGWSHTAADLWFATALYVLIFVLAFDRGFLATALSSKVPMRLGEWSYGIYMGQTFWLQAIRYFEQRWYPPDNTPIFGTTFFHFMWWVEPFMLVGICILWGALLTKAVEQPANAWLRRRLT
jgi:peptidoglycan/LPS O-acetylase OafA/YrhL